MGRFTDKEILEAIREGGKKYKLALDQLYGVECHEVFRLVRRNSGSASDSEDIFQEALVAFIANVKAGKFKGESSLRTYLHSIAYYKWMNELKRRDRHTQYEIMLKRKPDKSENFEEPLLERNFSEECKKLIHNLVDSLGQKCQELLDLKFFQYKTFAEIIEIMGYKNEQVARSKVHKCLQSLREGYGKSSLVIECLSELR